MVAAAAAALALTGCTGGADDGRSTGPTASTAPAVAFDATLTQSRTDLGTPMVNAQLTNVGADTVTVQSIAIASPQLAPTAPTPKGTTYAPGRIIDLRIPYGRPRCDADTLASATYELTLSDGSELSLPVDGHGTRWLAGLYRHDCAVRALEAVARVSFAPQSRRVTRGGEQYLEGSVRVRRPVGGPAQPFEIRELGGSVLLRLLPRSPGQFPWVLRPGVHAGRVPYLMGTFRCGPHELSASQQTFLLSAYAATPGVRLQRLIIVPPPPLRAAAQRLLVDVCVKGE